MAIFMKVLKILIPLPLPHLSYCEDIYNYFVGRIWRAKEPILKNSMLFLLFRSEGMGMVTITMIREI